MEQGIIELLHSENKEDVELGVEIMHIKHPDLFIYTDDAERCAWFVPGIMRPLIDIDRLPIQSLSWICNHCEENNYYKIKGQ